MANAMSPKSSSYGRSSEVASFSLNFAPHSQDPISGKFGQLAILEQFSIFKQSVFRAELVQTMTRSEIEQHCERLKQEIEKECPNLFFKLSFHLQGDNTEKSSHIHLWGDATPEAEAVIERYIYENRLTVQQNNNITYMEIGKRYDVTDDAVIETQDDGEKIEIDRDEIFFKKNEKEFDDFIRESNKIMDEINLVFEKIGISIKEIKSDAKEIDYEEIDRLLKLDFTNNFFEE